MISTRIKRGAVRTHVLIRESLQHYNSTAMTRSVFTARSLFLTFIAIRLILPVPVLADSSPTQIDTLLDSEPPSMVRLDENTLKAIIITRNSDSEPHFSKIKMGKSFNTQSIEEQQALATQEAERVQKERQEAAKKQAAERARSWTFVAVPVSSGSAQEMVKTATVNTFGEAHWQAMASLITRESGFNPNSYNRTSGACGLFQALPCSKMGGMEINNQINWGMRYIQNRYGNPTNAWQHWLTYHWY